MKNIDSFYLKQEEPNKSCFLALRSIILNADSRLWETVKYGMPCFCIAKKPICYLWKDKLTSEPYILMVDGIHLNHSLLEQGNRAKMKIFSVNPNEDIDIVSIHEILKEAVSLIVF
jgi:hypothetical protein